MPAMPHATPLPASPGHAHAPSHADVFHAGSASSLLMNRVGRVLQDMAAARVVSDDEIRQHAKDCTFLMESAYDRFQAYGDVSAREETYTWMHRRDEALRMLSQEWKAAREAEILQATGAGYFIDQAEADRLALAGRAVG